MSPRGSRRTSGSRCSRSNTPDLGNRFEVETPRGRYGAVTVLKPFIDPTKDIPKQCEGMRRRRGLRAVQDAAGGREDALVTVDPLDAVRDPDPTFDDLQDLTAGVSRPGGSRLR